MKRRMNNRILRTFLCGACLMGCAVVPFLAPAQTLRTSYFLESMPMRHRLNPALVSDRGYISIPAIGNINVATQSNVGLTAFLYPLPDGGLTTFMNPIVSAETPRPDQEPQCGTSRCRRVAALLGFLCVERFQYDRYRRAVELGYRLARQPVPFYETGNGRPRRELLSDARPDVADR